MYQMKGPLFLCCTLLAAVQLTLAARGVTQYGTVHLNSVTNSGGGANTHIMSGTPATQGQIPFQVAIFMKDFVKPDGFCGGILISDTVVMTAAHCVDGYNGDVEFEVVLGTLRVLDTNSFGYVSITSRTKVVHQDFDYAFGLNNDIALLILPQPVTLSSTIQPILLPRLSDVGTDLAGTIGRTSGWGQIGDVGGFVNEDLLYADVTIVDNEECVNAYGSNYVPPTKMCLSTNDGTLGPCNGDSGGPLFVTNSAGEEIVVGITSFGASAGCESGYPEVDTRVSSFIEWVAANGGPAVRP